jgi:hypothetical protein
LEEAECKKQQQLAARMLWAALDTTSLLIRHYGGLLHALKSNPQPILKNLTPEAVQRFVLQAAGIQDGVESTLVWVWDEVNAVQLEEGQMTSFCQEHLSEAVVMRRHAQEQFKMMGPNVFPVLLACTTRGSSTSLALTASKKARVQDLQVPVPEELQPEMPLVFMDMMRRLDPQPPPIASELQKLGITSDADFSALSSKQRQALKDLCPKHVCNVFEWAFGNMRGATHLAGAISGQPEGETHHLKLGGAAVKKSLVPNAL